MDGNSIHGHRKRKGDRGKRNGRREEQISLSPPTTHMSSSPTSSADLESRLGQGLDTDEAARRGPISVCWEHLQLADQGHTLTNSEAFWRSGK